MQRICEVCLRSDILCSACKGKVEEGLVKPIELEVQRAVYGLRKGVELLDVFDEGEDIVIVTKEGDAAKLIGPGGKYSRILSKKFGKRIKIIERGDLRKTVQSIISPANLLGINIIYQKERERYKVRVKGPFWKKEKTEKILSSVLGKKTEVTIE